MLRLTQPAKAVRISGAVRFVAAGLGVLVPGRVWRLGASEFT